MIGMFRIDNLDYSNKSATVGLDISSSYRRLGYARETYAAMIPYFFKVVKLNRLALITLATNIAAINLYENLGFIREGVLREAFLRDLIPIDAIQFSLLASDPGY